MSVDYTIAAIPTVYRGRQYRSRLEAKWAAFFDLAGWRHEYEPFDLGVWSPDFVFPDAKVLVEIKPITSFHLPTAKKMMIGAKAGSFNRTHSLLLIGTSPNVIDGKSVHLGWMWNFKENHGKPVSAALAHWLPLRNVPGLILDLVSVDACMTTQPPAWTGHFSRVSGDSTDWDLKTAYPDYTMALWAKATNAVQWQAPSK